MSPDGVLNFDSARCLLSLEEIAEHMEVVHPVGPAEAEASVLKPLSAFLFAERPEATSDTDKLRGLIAVREVHDALDRLRLARRHAAPNGMSVSAALAAFRQEGGLVIAPDAPSIEQAPPIVTDLDRLLRGDREVMDLCRTPFVWLDGRRPLRRGHQLVLPGDSSTELLVRVNLLVTGGLDSVVQAEWLPNVGLNDPKLGESVAAAKTMKDHDELLTAFGQRARESMAQYPWSLGVVATRLEACESPDSVADAFNEGVADTRALLASHQSESVERGRGQDRFRRLRSVVVDGRGATERALEVYLRWLSSRRRYDTLLSWEHRRLLGSSAQGLPKLSPFLTYLRFHVADAHFVGILLRLLVHLPTLVTRWTKHRREWSRAKSLTDVLGKKKLSVLSTRLAPLQKAVAAWKPVAAPFWRFRGVGPLLGGNLRGNDDNRIRTAAVVALLLQTIEECDLWDAIAIALEYTPPSTLGSRRYADDGLDIIGGARKDAEDDIMRKAHSYEALRLAYAKWLGEPD